MSNALGIKTVKLAQLVAAVLDDTNGTSFHTKYEDGQWEVSVGQKKAPNLIVATGTELSEVMDGLVSRYLPEAVS